MIVELLWEEEEDMGPLTVNPRKVLLRNTSFRVVALNQRLSPKVVYNSIYENYVTHS